MRGIVDEDDLDESSETDSSARNYFYRVKYPGGEKGYCTDGLEITKFERDYETNFLTYKFIKAYPFSINSIPVTYDGSNLLKCTVGFSYIRYITDKSVYEKPQVEPSPIPAPGVPVPPIVSNRREDLDIWALTNRGMIGSVGTEAQKNLLADVDRYYNTGTRQNRLQSLSRSGGYRSGTGGGYKGVAMPGLTLNFKEIQ